MRVLFLPLVCALLLPQVAFPAELRTFTPEEDAQMVLRNPDMGWVLYENYPLDQHPNGSSTLLTLPEESFPEVSDVALMFSWQDVENKPGEYDFSKVDYAYDWWKKRGKNIQLRISAESLLWWETRVPPTGKGVPDYVLDRLAPAEKQVRKLENQSYTVVDARNPFYQERLKRFLAAVASHYSGQGAVTLVDLRGFGVWGEWHSGFEYPTTPQRHAALSQVIDLWSEAFSKNWLSLSYSYDPDGPEELYAGPTDKFAAQFTTNYQQFLHYSAFDHALTKTNLSFRRDGCGGAVHSNERKLCEEAFALHRGPLFTEFLGGYAANKKAGTNWVNWMVDDALSLHPNYMNLLGWQGGDALAFTKERPDLVQKGALSMGYRLVPISFRYAERISQGEELKFEVTWVNKGVGRALRDYQMQMRAVQVDRAPVSLLQEIIPTSRWIKGNNYSPVHTSSARLVPGRYELELALFDQATGRFIALPLRGRSRDWFYPVGSFLVE